MLKEPLERALSRTREARDLLLKAIQTEMGLEPAIEESVTESYARICLVEETILTMLSLCGPAPLYGVPQMPPQLSGAGLRSRFAGAEVQNQQDARFMEEETEAMDPDGDTLEEMATRGGRLTQFKSMGRR